MTLYRFTGQKYYLDIKVKMITVIKKNDFGWFFQPKPMSIKLMR